MLAWLELNTRVGLSKPKCIQSTFHISAYWRQHVHSMILTSPFKMTQVAMRLKTLHDIIIVALVVFVNDLTFVFCLLASVT